MSGSPINAAYFTALTAQVNAATSCAELQAVATQALGAANAALAAASARLTPIEQILPLLTAPGANLSQIVNWIQTLIDYVLTPMVIPATTLAAQVTEMTAAIASLTSAITSAAANFENCSITT